MPFPSPDSLARRPWPNRRAGRPRAAPNRRAGRPLAALACAQAVADVLASGFAPAYRCCQAPYCNGAPWPPPSTPVPVRSWAVRGWGIAVAHPNPVSCLCQQGYDIPRMNVKISSSSRHSMAYRPARSRSASESNRATQGLVQRKSRTFAGPIHQPLLRSPSLPPSFRLTNLQPPPPPSQSAPRYVADVHSRRPGACNCRPRSGT